MLPDLPLRLDAPTPRVHRSLETAARFPQASTAQRPTITRSDLQEARTRSILTTPPPGVAGYEVFRRGRF
jgi:hypothetical protein